MSPVTRRKADPLAARRTFRLICRGAPSREPRTGAIAQLGERLHGMQEVRGSIPLGSTIPHFGVENPAYTLKGKVISAVR